MISPPQLRQIILEKVLDEKYALTKRKLVKNLLHHLPESATLLSYATLVVYLLATLPSHDASVKILMISGIYLLVAMFWMNSLAETRKKAAAWGYVAHQTGLICTVGRIFSGYSVVVTGNYRGRHLRLATDYHGLAQLQSTVITVKTKPPRNALLNIRGPFSPSEIKRDQVTQNLFEAVKAREVGRNGRFYVRGEPYGMLYNLYGKTEAWEALEKMPAPTTIEIENNSLKFEQMIQLRNPDDLLRAFEIVSDMADALEQ